MKVLEKEIQAPYSRGSKKPDILYNESNTCEYIDENEERCKEKLKPGNARRERNKDHIPTGRWLCDVHGNRHRDKTYGKSYVLKLLSGCRTGNLDPNSYKAVGNLFEKLTCKWKGVKNLNDENDNYEVPIDHSADSEGKVLQTDHIIQQEDEREREKIFDYMICYCTTEDRKIIERIYIFPKEVIIERNSIVIVKKPTDHHGNLVTPWYEKYRINEEI